MNKGQGFTVWCSDGYGNDGWHCYQGPPDKVFDTTWKTVEDANSRARYLFYHHNPWGVKAEEIDDEPEETMTEDGLMTFRVDPPDSSIWTVSVMPASAFKHLDHVVFHRHSDDRASTSASTFGRGVSCAF